MSKCKIDYDESSQQIVVSTWPESRTDKSTYACLKHVKYSFTLFTVFIMKCHVLCANVPVVDRIPVLLMWMSALIELRKSVNYHELIILKYTSVSFKSQLSGNNISPSFFAEIGRIMRTPTSKPFKEFLLLNLVFLSALLSETVKVACVMHVLCRCSPFIGEMSELNLSHFEGFGMETTPRIYLF